MATHRKMILEITGFLIIVFYLLAPGVSSSQNLLWDFIRSDLLFQFASISVDKENSLYLCGSSDDEKSIIVIKYDSSGHLAYRRELYLYARDNLYLFGWRSERNNLGIDGD